MKMDEQRVLTEEEKTDAYVRKKVMEAADAREAELNADHSLDSIHLTDAMQADMQRRIAEIDAARVSAADVAENATSCAASQDVADHTVESDMSENAAEAENVAYHTVESDMSENAAEAEGVANHTVESDVPENAAEAEDVACHTAESGMPENAAEAEDVANHTAESGMPHAAGNEATAPDVLAMLSEEDRRALELGKKAMRFRKHRKALRAAGIAAVIGLGIFGISMTSEANRLWWVNLWDGLVGKESVSYLQSAEGESRLNAQIQEVCAEIKEKTDINAVYFLYMPKGVVLDDYMIREDIGTAMMYYLYREDTILSVCMIKKKNNSVTGHIKDGDILDKISVETDYGTMEIRVQENLSGEKNYSVEFMRDDCQYSIFGMMPQEEFVELIKNIMIF